MSLIDRICHRPQKHVPDVYADALKLAADRAPARQKLIAQLDAQAREQQQRAAR